MVSLHSQRHFKTHLLFLPGVAELKLDVIDPIKCNNSFFLAYFTSPMLVGCVGVVWPFDTFKVISGDVSEPSDTVPGQASWAVYQYLVPSLSPVTDDCPS